MGVEDPREVSVIRESAFIRDRRDLQRGVPRVLENSDGLLQFVPANQISEIDSPAGED